ncbi:endothelin-converting enzyme homolog [Drosophila ficusphila]|uniref:endothelin-converting enzyme homolog n=1 Tax=Drosophila ficusphila TaxID=30025 RepID=UPI0007E66EA8|nr:endothelin-converting enzyme homolog [Drosophila ficusphila]
MRTTRSAWKSFLLGLLIQLGVQLNAVLGVRPNNMGRMQMMGGNFPDSREEQMARQSMAADMRKYMNLSVDPCTDFFEYACGQWGQHHKRQLRLSELFTAQQLMETKISEQLQQLLTQPLPTQHHPNSFSGPSMANVRKVRAFYESCVAVEANAGERRRFLMKILKDNGGLRNVPNSNWQHNRHWVQTLGEMRRNYGLDILLGLEFDLNLQQMQGKSIYFGEPKLTIIPKEHCNSLATQDAQVNNAVHEQIQQQVADNVRDWFGIDTGEAARFAGDIIRFEFELCKQMGEQDIIKNEDEPQAPVQAPLYGVRSRTGQDRLHRHKDGKSLIELTKEFGNQLDFKMLVEVILEEEFPADVYLRSPEYVKHLVRTVRANNRITIGSYIIYVAANELNQPPEEVPSQRARQCVLVTQRLFPQVLGELFQRHVQRDNAKHDLNAIFSDVIKALEEQFHVEWMDENDRRAARTRLSQYRVLLPDYQSLDLSGLQFQKNEDYWHRLEVTLKYRSRQQFEALRGNDFNQDGDGILDAFEVRAALSPRQQTVLVGWGLLQPPYYNYYYPRALKYALVGQRLASALVQAFDEEEWNHHPQATSLWNDYTMSGYRNVSECQRAQYSSYLYNEPGEFRNATRLREIIADSSGLNLAFNAYLAWLEQQDHKLRVLLSKETLPELNFTNTQLFFIYFAQTRCWAKNDQQEILKSMPLMQHTLERWDVNGPLSNSPEFGREFNCALGTPMNSGDKCLVY